MEKLPIGETIRFAYQFTFGQIGTIIGLIWIPMLIIVIGDYLTSQMGQNGGGANGQSALIAVLFLLIGMLLTAMMMVAITQQALGLRQGQALAHFVLGPVELRACAAIFGLMLLYFLFLAGYFLGSEVTAIVAKLLAGYGMAGRILGILVTAGYAIVGFCALIYAIVRLSFVFVPSLIDGGGFGIARSWEVTRGNFWRIFVISWATIVPLLIIYMVLLVAIIGPYFLVPGPAVFTDMAVQTRFMTVLLAQLHRQSPYLVGLKFVIAPLLYGLALAPAAFAYRALTKTGD